MKHLTCSSIELWPSYVFGRATGTRTRNLVLTKDVVPPAFGAKLLLCTLNFFRSEEPDVSRNFSIVQTKYQSLFVGDNIRRELHLTCVRCAGFEGRVTMYSQPAFANCPICLACHDVRYSPQSNTTRQVEAYRTLRGRQESLRQRGPLYGGPTLSRCM